MSAGPMEATGTVVPPVAAAVTPPGGLPPRRRARVELTRIDPWSVMKLGFLLSVALAVVMIVSTALLWWILDVAGVFTTISEQVGEVTGDSTAFDVAQVLSLGRVMTFALLVAMIDVVLLTALATLGAFLFNLAAGLVGGAEVTLAEGE